jgi:hypothetical protein
MQPDVPCALEVTTNYLNLLIFIFTATIKSLSSWERVARRFSGEPGEGEVE